MDSYSSQISDDDLASSIEENGILSSAEAGKEDGLLEPGIVLEQDNEEKFSIDDFESIPSSESPSDQTESPQPLSVEDLGDGTAPPLPQASPVEAEVGSASNTVPDGEVAEFRKTLSDLSRQLEIDRLTFLHKRLREGGKSVPDLARIASDIRGETPIHPIGDSDIYSKRPFSRLQGWIVGLSFGIGRRAKRFKS
jgi:hypothetical protein